MPEDSLKNQISQRPAKRPGRIFYGWLALIGVMLTVFMVGGIYINTYGVFLPVMSDSLEWNRGTVALALSLGILTFGLPSPLFSILVARFGPRKTLFWGNLGAALAIAAVGLVQEVWHLYLLYSIIGISAGIGGYIAGATLVANWFIKKRPLALGMFTACGGLGGFVFPPIATALIESIGWRWTWVTMAGLILIIGVFLGCVVLIRNKPEDMGLLPDGAEPTPETEVQAAEPVAPAAGYSVGAGLKQLARQKTIWLIAGFTATNSFALGTMGSHQAAHVQDVGYSAMAGATAMSLLAGTSFAGGVIFGFLALKFKAKRLTVFTLVMMLAAMAVMLTSTTLPAIYICVSVIGLGNGAVTASMPTILGMHYHGDWYGRSIGMVIPMLTIGQSAATYVAGVLYDMAGSYTPAFLTVTGLLVIGLICTLLIRAPATAR